jgi:uncharacterized phiE125 gp8 family phage protein
MQWSNTTPPTSFPITTLQALTQARIDDVEPNRAWVADAIANATQYAEDATQLSFITRTITATYFPEHSDILPQSAPFPPYSCLPLFRCPLQSVSSVKDGDGNAVNNWQIRSVGFQDFVQLNSSVLAPCTIVYVAGYGSTASAVPSDIKQAIVAHIAHMNRFREADADSIPVGLDYIYDKYRLGEIG